MARKKRIIKAKFYKLQKGDRVRIEPEADLKMWLSAGYKIVGTLDSLEEKKEPEQKPAAVVKMASKIEKPKKGDN